MEEEKRMKKGTKFRGLVCVIGLCSLFGLQVHAQSEATVRIYADDNFVASSSVQTIGENDASRGVYFKGEVYSFSKKNACFGVYFLNSKGEWVFAAPSKPCNIGESFGYIDRLGPGNYAFLKIVAGNDMNGYLNKGAIGNGTIQGQ